MARTVEYFRVEGLAELDGALTELPKALAKPTLIRALTEAAQPIADAESAFAPKLTGRLALSPSVGTRLTRRQRKMNEKASAAEVYVGPTPHPKSIQTEFGNAHQAAHPHLRPAFDSQVMNVLAKFGGMLAGQIEKTRARVARQAERLAAKMKA